MDRKEQKQRLIEALARFLVQDQAGKSIRLQMERERSSPVLKPALIEEWVRVRDASELKGYPTLEEAVKYLTDLLL